jgi:hypothetical protein
LNLPVKRANKGFGMLERGGRLSPAITSGREEGARAQAPGEVGDDISIYVMFCEGPLALLFDFDEYSAHMLSVRALAAKARTVALVLSP